MKKALKINISGFIFHIDEDAYEKLHNYLDLITSRLDSAEEGKEVIADVEARVAELFQERMVDGKEVINSEDVDAIIGVLGKPEDFGGYESENEDAEPVRSSSTRKQRRLYRNPDNRVLAGVCSGLGVYFNIDPIIIRLIFVASMFLGGSSVLIYIILIFAIPMAKTTTQKLEMQGEPVTLSTIEKKIKEEFGDIKDGAKQFGKRVQDDNSFDRFVHLLTLILNFVIRSFIIIAAITIIVFGISLLIGFMGSFFFDTNWGPHHSDFSIQYFTSMLVDRSHLTIGLMSLFVVVMIPVLSLIYAGVRMIFRFKVKDKFVWLGALGLWFVALMVLAFVTISELQKYRAKGVATETFPVAKFKTDTIYLDAIGKQIDENDYEDFKIHLNDMVIVNENSKDKLYGRPRLNIERSKTADFELVVKRKARALDKKIASLWAKNILYNWSQKDSLLLFDNHFFIPENEKWHNQELFLTLKVPVGKYVYLSRKTENVIYDIDNVDDYWDGDMTEKMWKMTHEGLKLVHSNNPHSNPKTDSVINDMKDELDKQKNK